MAGHSKWANIRFRKGAQDVRRGKLFTKLIREITVAARNGGGDPAGNPRLRTAIDKAFANNMTRENVDRAIARGTGELEGVSYDEVRYEGYGPGGAAVLVECTTDNHKRTVSEVRHAFSKHGGNLGTDGSVAYLFERVGIIQLPAGSDEEAVMEVAAGAGAEDVETQDDGRVEVVTPADGFHAVRDALKAAGFEAEQAELVQRPTTEVGLDTDDSEKILRLLDALEELDDTQEVFTNADIADQALEEAAG
ncbi:MAG: YebC/PmpR family DNA-binding transcriptional regulator [Gammaproteobacteria bacterium]|jgi:YebC/PmpR family DNA-binding regulatory protein|nr:YebC/PmpR family DNA-binding transcriptional regulator [Gammaproteobacteria bacterium]